MNMSSWDQGRVFEEALDKINSPKGWLILAGSAVGLYVLSKKNIVNMSSWETRRTLENLIDKIGD